MLLSTVGVRSSLPCLVEPLIKAVTQVDVSIHTKREMLNENTNVKNIFIPLCCANICGVTITTSFHSPLLPPSPTTQYCLAEVSHKLSTMTSHYRSVALNNTVRSVCWYKWKNAVRPWFRITSCTLSLRGFGWLDMRASHWAHKLGHLSLLALVVCRHGSALCCEPSVVTNNALWGSM